MLFFGSCTYKYNIKESGVIINPTDTVKFATQVVPIFSDATCISCHKSGSTRPDLSASAAYSEITSMGLLNLTDPAQSKLYQHPLASTSTHSWKKYTDNQAAIILMWITQGAKNN